MKVINATTPAYDWHICMVSDQAAPNLTPIAHDSLSTNNVLLIVSAQMKTKASYLKNALILAGVKRVERLELENELDSSELFSKLETWLVEHATERICLNITGGNKLMAFSAYDCARGKLHDRLDAIYLDIKTQKIIFLTPSDKVPEAVNAALSLNVYLKAYGYEVDSSQPFCKNQDFEHFCHWMLINIDKQDKALGEFNRYLSDFDTQAKTKAAALPSINPQNAVLMEAQKLKLFSPKMANKETVEFKFLYGGWLEYATANSVAMLHANKRITDWAMGLNISSSKSNNELDIAFFAHGSLHIIECKTRNLQADKEIINNAIYKLDSLKKVGGLTTKLMLLSYRKVSEAQMKRAADAGIKVLQGAQLSSLSSQLSMWISQ